MTPRDRLQWIIDNMFGGTPAHYAEAAGLGRQTLSAAMKRMNTSDGASMSADNLEKLAVAAGVTSKWLLHGEGAPPKGWPESPPSTSHETQRHQSEARSSMSPAHVRETKVVLDDRYPNRDAAIAIYEGVAPPPVLKAVRSLSLKSAEDRPYEDWCKVIDKLIADRRRIEAGETINVGDLDPSILDLHI